MRAFSVSSRADADISRLLAFQARRSLRVKETAEGRLADGLRLIRDYPMAGIAIGKSFRQIVLRFGGGGFVFRYRVTGDEIVVTRIWHTLEERR